MHFFELIQEAGWVGYLVIALGGLGITLGFFAVIALPGKSPSAFTLGVAAADESEGWTQNPILLSVPLQDEKLHARAVSLQKKAEVPVEAPPKSGALLVGSGGMAKEAIAQAVRGARNEVQFCYERELQKSPQLEGKITVKFVIGADGNVKSANDDSDVKFPNPKVTGCLLSVVRKLKFPSPNGGGKVIVRYPFVFKAS